jgi:stage V sporulation protein AD
MLNGYFIKSLMKGEFKNMLFIPTGALLSRTSTLQGCNIPCVAHAVEIERVV